jgi:hypothetical protein
VLDRSLPAAGSRDLAFEAQVLPVGGKLCAVDRQLLFGEAKARLGGGKVPEEELQQPWIAQLGRLVGRRVKPRLERGLPIGGDREHSTPAALRLALLDHQPETGEAIGLAVQERVRERPEVAERRPHVPLEVVRRRRSLASEEPEDEIRRGGQAAG